MTELSDYSAFAEPPLSFPINGKRYTVPPLGIEAGLVLQGVIAGTDKTFAKKNAVDLWKLVLGSLWDEMVADGVPLDAATRAGVAALADHQYGRVIAEAAWEAGEDPNRLAAYMDKKAAEQKAAGNRATRRSKSTGTATKTPSRASTKATTSRPR